MTSHPSRIVASYPIRHAATRTSDVVHHIAALLDNGLTPVDLSDHDRHAHTVHLRAPGQLDEDR